LNAAKSSARTPRVIIVLGRQTRNVRRDGIPLAYPPADPSDRRAIGRACEAAFPAPEEQDPTAWRRAHRFGPARLRHNAATAIRAEHGLEAAQLVLGHSSAVVTDAVYAERDQRRLAEVAMVSG